MDRRLFIARLAGVFAAVNAGGAGSFEPHRRWCAFVRTGVPESLWIPRSACNAALFELRIYHAETPGFREGFERLLGDVGLDHVRVRKTTYLIPFGSLRERAEAWTRVNSHPEWAAFAREIQSYGFGLYRESVEPVS